MNDLKSYATRRLIESGLLAASTTVWTRHGSTRYLWDDASIEAASQYTLEGQGADLWPTGGAPQMPSDDRGTQPLPYGRGSVHAVDQIMVDVSYRVIADHVRCLTFALTDGAVPSNEGRGYVLRRILRRAVRYGRQYFNMHEPFLCDLVESLVSHMGDAFPELRTGPDPKRPRENVKHVVDLLRDEEASFIKTLDRGIRLFNEAAEFAVEHHHGRISGEAAFKLHDTFGFPIDLTELMAEERGLTIDIGEYERLMEEAREKARGAGKKFATLTSNVPEMTTDDHHKYDTLQLDAEIVAYGTHGGLPDSGEFEWRSGESGEIYVDRTCFYAEQGGQVGDKGWIKGTGWLFEVQDTLRGGNTIEHRGVLVSGSIRHIFGARESERAVLNVDLQSRYPTMQNHTATHIMNWALREVLGDHVQQKGSLVDPEKTRFDLSHNQPISNDELGRIESLVNEQIAAKLPVYAASNEDGFVDQKQAREINTLRAVFGEKYPDRVRVVSIGAPIDELLRDPKHPKWMKFSVEFCGGTHVKNSSEIERFVLTHEEGVAKGVRRVIGVSGETARKAEELGRQLLDEATDLLKQSPERKRGVGSSLPSGGPVARAPGSDGDDSSLTVAAPKEVTPSEGAAVRDQDLASRLAAFTQAVNDAVIPVLVRHELREKLAELQKIAKQQEKQSAAASGDAVMDKVKSLHASAKAMGGVTVVVGEVPAAPVDALRGAVDWVRQKSPSSAVLFAMVDDNRVTLLAGMSKDVVELGVKAGDLIKEISPLVGGKGGGRPDMAQGGGTDAGGLPMALEAAGEWIATRLR